MRSRQLALLMALLAPSVGVAGPSVLLELFTSQGCYSCPAADVLLAERYLGQADVLPLELHVDYWDKLVHGGSSWKDPFSSSDYTGRQVRYATTTLRNPYTPQVIIQGSYSASGTDRNNIDHALDEVRKLNLTAGWDIGFTQEDSAWKAHVRESAGEVEALAVTYLHMATTDISGGENKGKVLDNYNVVTELRNVGLVGAGSAVELGTPGAGENCALILQRPDQGVVIGAWPCELGGS